MPLKPSDLLPPTHRPSPARRWVAAAVAAAAGALVGAIAGVTGPNRLTVLRGPVPGPPDHRPEPARALVAVLGIRLRGLVSDSADLRRRTREDVDRLLRQPSEVRHALAAALSPLPGPMARRYLAVLSSDEDVLVRLEARAALIERVSGKRR